MDINHASITTLRTLLDTNKVSPRELYDHYGRRVKENNAILNAFLHVASEPHIFNQNGPLAGIPIAVKDNFCTHDMPTTASSRLLDGYMSPYDATVVSKLRNAGATIIGKTNLDAWAHGSSTETSDYGPTRNPWNTARAAGGSSGGSVASVSSCLVPAAIGSETAGSIRQPASWCGVVGLKPTYGRVSRYGLIAMASSLDSPGPLTTCVADAALMLEVLAGPDIYDATASERTVPSYVHHLREKCTYTIGVADSYFEGVHKDIVTKVQETINTLKNMGHTIKKIDLICPESASATYTVLQRAEVSSNLARFDGMRYGRKRHIFQDEARKRIMTGIYTLSQAHYDAIYKKAEEVRARIKQNYEEVFQEVDLIVTPSTPCTALMMGDYASYAYFGETMDRMNESSSIAGLPGISLPCGLDSNNLPIGIQVIGNRFGEEHIINCAHYLEQELRFRDTAKNICTLNRPHIISSKIL